MVGYLEFSRAFGGNHAHTHATATAVGARAFVWVQIGVALVPFRPSHTDADGSHALDTNPPSTQSCARLKPFTEPLQ